MVLVKQMANTTMLQVVGIQNACHHIFPTTAHIISIALSSARCLGGEKN